MMCQSDQVVGHVPSTIKNSTIRDTRTQADIMNSSVELEIKSRRNPTRSQEVKPGNPLKRSVFSKKLDLKKYLPYQLPESSTISYLSPSDTTVETSSSNISEVLSSCDKNWSPLLHLSASVPRFPGSSLSSNSIDVHSPVDLSKHLPWLSHTKKSRHADKEDREFQPQMPELSSVSSDSSEQSRVSEQKRSIFGGSDLNLKSLKMRSNNSYRNNTILHHPSSPKLKSILRRSSFSTSSNSTNSMESILEKSQQEGLRLNEKQQIQKLPKRFSDVTTDVDERISRGECMIRSLTAPTPMKIQRFRSQSMLCLNKVSFSARVNVLEFRRTIEEQKSMHHNGWFSARELEEFKNNAIDEIQQYRARRANDLGYNPTNPYSGNFDSPYDSRSNLELFDEIQDILVVDCHDIFLKLFSDALVEMIPHINVVTAQSAIEAMESIKSAKEDHPENHRMHGFDIIIVEERLKRSDSFTRQQMCMKRASGNCHAASPAGVNELSQHEIQSNALSSGSELISSLTQQEISDGDRRCASLVIGVSAFLDTDGEKLRQAGANLIWGKPPPQMDSNLSKTLLNELLKKRGK